ncbi:MAG TPA: putative oxidoreductase C-terminal domain-containing protein [Burkholderiales bacterium]|nr:putative oxidoreductase C-terminal domain-containing protein [Burkholderiales bacterium]
MAAGKHALVVLNPGHFHAALTLRERHPRLRDDVYVYAEDGPELESFLRLVRSFNERAAAPTCWNLHVYRGADCLQRLCAERPGDVAVVAGRNDTKMSSILRLHAAGFFVLGDKPWIIGARQLDMLKEAAESPPLAMDIMTERYEIANRVQKALVERPQIFGRLRTDGDGPGIALRSVHHLYKTVGGRPLVRPSWFFDVAVQGEGIVDVTTHLVDLAQWMTGGDRAFDYERDIELVSARQWPTQVPRELFRRITGVRDFPEGLRDRVVGGALLYLCNACIDFRLHGVPVRVESLWAPAPPEGGGDTHCAMLRGSGADLLVEQDASTEFVTALSVRPVESGAKFAGMLADAIASLQDEFPGLGLRPSGGAFRITIPEMLRTTHEQHFARVLDQFLACIDSGEAPGDFGAGLVARYTLLARAAELSHGEA